jgi:hypothetical protein
MGIQRELAVLGMNATPLPGQTDWLAEAGILTPVPALPGSLGAVAHEPFLASQIKRLYDLMVIFTIGDFADGAPCSSYFDPRSPWYNVFYGAYGIRSYKPDGTPWGFRPDGSVALDEMLDVPWLDYNFLTAGCLGCPPAKMCFRVEESTATREGAWHVLDVSCVVPSGLHLRRDAVSPDLTYYVVFGVPPEGWLAGGRQSYEPVRMRGRMYFQPVADRTTLVWGGLTPNTPEGQRLLGAILDSMAPLYPR